MITASKLLTVILTSELISLLQANSEIAKQFSLKEKKIEKTPYPYYNSPITQFHKITTCCLEKTLWFSLSGAGLDKNITKNRLNILTEIPDFISKYLEKVLNI